MFLGHHVLNCSYVNMDYAERNWCILLCQIEDYFPYQSYSKPLIFCPEYLISPEIVICSEIRKLYLAIEPVNAVGLVAIL